MALYYKTSPPIADFIADHPAVKPVVRAGLKPIVAINAFAVNTSLVQKIATVSLCRPMFHSSKL